MASLTRIPGFIDHVVNKKAEIVRVYLPPDANCLLSVMDHCLRSRHYVNVVVAGKHPAPQWLSMDAARQALHRRHRHLAMGEQRSAGRARCGDGLRRRRADARDPRCGLDPAEASAEAQGPRRQCGRSHEVAAGVGASARHDRLRFRLAVHPGQAGHFRVSWLPLAHPSARPIGGTITTICTCAATRRRAPSPRRST